MWQPHITNGRLGIYILTCEDRSFSMPSSMMKNFMWSNLPSDFFWRAIFHITSYYHRQYVNNWEVVIPYPSFRLNDGQGGLNFTGIQLIQLDSFWWATPSHYGHFHRENDDWPVDLEWLGAFPKPIWVAGYIEVIYPISLWNGWFPPFLLLSH